MRSMEAKLVSLNAIAILKEILRKHLKQPKALALAGLTFLLPECGSPVGRADHGPRIMRRARLTK